eukprot:TRINITY_DN1795_c0_g1_i1.p1 TRINITY_DN1795_c0_g1~~TRINITY_DN1795_c0_g1_i1.p1  ORF type:complete len:1586 (-),score=330.44 TRINITY_DN1795_c0_g1_i1:114-4304(-)
MEELNKALRALSDANKNDSDHDAVLDDILRGLAQMLTKVDLVVGFEDSLPPKLLSRWREAVRKAFESPAANAKRLKEVKKEIEASDTKPKKRAAAKKSSKKENVEKANTEEVVGPAAECEEEKVASSQEVATEQEKTSQVRPKHERKLASAPKQQQRRQAEPAVTESSSSLKRSTAAASATPHAIAQPPESFRRAAERLKELRCHLKDDELGVLDASLLAISRASSASNEDATSALRNLAQLLTIATAKAGYSAKEASDLLMVDIESNLPPVLASQWRREVNECSAERTKTSSTLPGVHATKASPQNGSDVSPENNESVQADVNEAKRRRLVRCSQKSKDTSSFCAAEAQPANDMPASGSAMLKRLLARASSCSSSALDSLVATLDENVLNKVDDEKTVDATSSSSNSKLDYAAEVQGSMNREVETEKHEHEENACETQHQGQGPDLEIDSGVKESDHEDEKQIQEQASDIEQHDGELHADHTEGQEASSEDGQATAHASCEPHGEVQVPEVQVPDHDEKHHADDLDQREKTSLSTQDGAALDVNHAESSERSTDVQTRAVEHLPAAKLELIPNLLAASDHESSQAPKNSSAGQEEASTEAEPSSVVTPVQLAQDSLTNAPNSSKPEQELGKTRQRTPSPLSRPVLQIDSSAADVNVDDAAGKCRGRPDSGDTQWRSEDRVEASTEEKREEDLKQENLAHAAKEVSEARSSVDEMVATASAEPASDEPMRQPPAEANDDSEKLGNSERDGHAEPLQDTKAPAEANDDTAKLGNSERDGQVEPLQDNKDQIMSQMPKEDLELSSEEKAERLDTAHADTVSEGRNVLDPSLENATGVQVQKSEALDEPDGSNEKSSKSLLGDSPAIAATSVEQSGSLSANSEGAVEASGDSTASRLHDTHENTKVDVNEGERLCVLEASKEVVAEEVLVCGNTTSAEANQSANLTSSNSQPSDLTSKESASVHTESTKEDEIARSAEGAHEASCVDANVQKRPEETLQTAQGDEDMNQSVPESSERTEANADAPSTEIGDSVSAQQANAAVVVVASNGAEPGADQERKDETGDTKSLGTEVSLASESQVVNAAQAASAEQIVSTEGHDRNPAGTDEEEQSPTQDAKQQQDTTDASREKRPSLGPGTKTNDAEEMCMLCCDDVPAGKAYRLSCQHGWYCGDCMIRHAQARLDVGAVQVSCPQCGDELAERELRCFLPEDILKRLQDRSLEQAVSAVADIRPCPTPNCPMRVALEEGEEPRFKCPMCRKVSCLLCGARPYHKGLTCEEFAAKKKARNDEAAEAEKSFEQWMAETGTKRCPTCSAPVSKQNLTKQSTQSAECHKMMCRSCNTKFCFKCLSVLTENVTCGCSIDAHGFVDPRTGERVEHIEESKQRPRARGKARGRAPKAGA